MLPTAAPKPPRGERRQQLLDKRRRVRLDEEGAKARVRSRDGFRCRVPGCGLQKAGWALNVAHLDDKGMGGDKRLIRSQIDRLICLCFPHHQGSTGSLHSKDLRIEPETDQGTNGPCAFYRTDEQAGWMPLGVG